MCRTVMMYLWTPFSVHINHSSLFLNSCFCMYFQLLDLYRYEIKIWLTKDFVREKSSKSFFP